MKEQLAKMTIIELVRTAHSYSISIKQTGVYSELVREMASRLEALNLAHIGSMAALEAAEKRVAEYRVALNNLAAVARRFLPDYDEHPDIQVADDLLEREELEVRTLSVKLPKASRVKLVSGEYVHGWRAYDVTCAISNAGIKLQIEGE